VVAPPATGAQLEEFRLNAFVPAACVTVTVCPPIVTVAVRANALVVSAAVSVTLPLPVPLPGLTVNHPRLLVAVHVASLAFDVTVTLVLAPLAAGLQLVWLRDSVTLSNPSCVTVTVCPPTVTVAVRVD
jgi:hypothetical protein